MKKLLTLFLAICMICTLLPFSAFAAEVKSGTCGPTLSWSLDSNGTLTVRKIGESAAMEQYSNSQKAPWNNYKDQIKTVVINGAENVGSYAFYECRNINKVIMFNTVTSIGAYAFAECDGIANIIIPYSVISIDKCAFYGCENITTVYLSSGLKGIDNNAFYAVNRLSNVYFSGSEGAWRELKSSSADGNSPLWNATVHYNTTYEFNYEQLKTTNYVPTTTDNQQFVSCASDTGIIIPGLSKSDGMIPQGLAYWKAKGWFIISSYSTKNEESIISVIDSATGKLVRQFSLSGCKSHVGGIAVSDCNLYVATGREIGYIPLSTIENKLSSGATGRLSFSDTDSTTLLGKAGISYMSSYKDPSTNRYCLLIGNFYYANSKYNTPASSSANSVICSLKLDSDSMNGSAGEWKNLRNNFKSPKFTINLAKDIDRVQYAVFNPANNKLYLSRSWTRNINSSSYISAIDVYNFNGTSCTLKTNQKQTTLKDLPMSEGICLVGNYLYNLFESGADKYANGSDGDGRCQYPSDTIWKIDLNKLQTARAIIGGAILYDVVLNSYYATPVSWALENGITNGVDDTHFAPDDDCTRGQIVTFLWRAKGEPDVSGVKNPFKDIKSTDYYYKAVLWAVKNGITTGTDDTHFAPNNTCTRAQSVTFMWRAEGQPGVKDVKNPFVDVKSSDYYYKAVLWAVKNGITTGIDATHFAPDNTCTRGQIVTFLYRDLK